MQPLEPRQTAQIVGQTPAVTVPPATGIAALPPETRHALESLRTAGRLPEHVAIIMDGNGRWARRRGQDRKAGHRAGAESVRAVTRLAREVGLKSLTLYAFSEQNWQRPRDEVDALLGLLVDYLASEIDELKRSDIKLLAFGNLQRLPLPVRLVLETTLAATADHKSMKLGLCLSYGGREEIVQAVQRLAQRVAKGQLRPEQIDEAAIEAELWTAPLGGPPDLLIRTSGEQRLSNFLLWQSAYAELAFVPTPWPEFRELAFAAALCDYSRRDRRFGGLGNAEGDA